MRASDTQHDIGDSLSQPEGGVENKASDLRNW